MIKEFYHDVAEGLPLNRVGQPENVAESILYLLRNNFTTGEMLHVVGGHRLV